MNFDTVAALSAAVAALVAAFQLWQFRFAHGVDLIFNLEDRFDAPDLVNARKLAAKALQNHSSTEEIDTILDYFETLGILVRRHVVDDELAWNSFSHWVLRYAVLTKDHIEARRKTESDDTYWKDFEFLVKRLTKIEKKKRHLKFPPSYSEKQLDRFLKEEISE
jgi:hypothetical protein